MAIDQEFDEMAIRARQRRAPRRRSGVDLVPLNTLVKAETHRLLVQIAARQNVGYGEVLDYVIAAAERKRLKKLERSCSTVAISM